MRNQFFRTLSAWCFKSTLSTYEPTMYLIGAHNYSGGVSINSALVVLVHDMMRGKFQIALKNKKCTLNKMFTGTKPTKIEL